ncbi:MAG: cytochrome P450 [Egibacteraceae bacterium]
MSSGTAERVDLVAYRDVRDALYDRSLSRAFDKRTFAEGNHRAGVLSTQHGQDHKLRRRLENPLFSRQRLFEYERDLFPAVLERLLERLLDTGSRDLFRLGMQLSVVLAARRAGIDHDESPQDLSTLARHAETIAQGAAILDIVGDKEAVRRRVTETQAELDSRYVSPSRRRREGLLDSVARGERPAEAVPDDVLTRMLQHRHHPAYDFDDGVILREVATFLHGGTHTSAQTLVNTFDLLFSYFQGQPSARDRLESDRTFVQRCVHETLRLRPTTPRIKRLAEADTVVGDQRIERGTTVVLDVASANRDASLFGPSPETFNPDRRVDDEVARWGLSFGAGPHICIGRAVAGGFPLAPDGDPRAEDGGHLSGLVAVMVQQVARAGAQPDPAGRQEVDDRTDRGTRWRHYDVRFEGRRDWLSPVPRTDRSRDA